MTESKELVSLRNLEGNAWKEYLETENSVSPLVDIFEKDDNYVLVVSMPGVKRENIRVKIEGEDLFVFGKINYHERSHYEYILNENEIGNYYRRFKLSESIDQSKIEAMYENGQLVIIMPKDEKLKARTIEIN
jgi:HSP20 family protein